jgi:hypothetical protein
MTETDIPYLVRQIKFLIQQNLRISEDLEYAHKRIDELEKIINAKQTKTTEKKTKYLNMSIIKKED